MNRTNLNELSAFRVVAECRSFTKAAAQLGVSPSALSQTIRALEARLGIRLLTRTTRNVSATQAGELMLSELTPALDSIGATLESLNRFRQNPFGTIRLTAGEHRWKPCFGPSWSG